MTGRTHDAPTRRDLLSLGGLAGAAVGASLLAQATPALAQNAGLKVALVDIGVVFKGYRRKDDLEKQVNAKKEKLDTEARSQATEIESLRKSLDLLKAGSDMWRSKKKELQLAAKRFEVLREGMEEELKLEVENLTLIILDEIEEKVREFGKSQGYDLIIKVDTKGWGDERFQERIFRAQVSSVIYHDPKLDVTNTIVAALNDKAWIEKCQAKSFGTNAPTPPDKPK